MDISITSTGDSSSLTNEIRWDFDDSSNYTFDSNYVEIKDSNAQLKIVDQIFSGTDFNSGTHVGTYLDSQNRIGLVHGQSSAVDVRSILSSRTSSLFAYWKFEGNLNDESSNAFHLTASGNAATTSSEKKSGLLSCFIIWCFSF